MGTELHVRSGAVANVCLVIGFTDSTLFTGDIEYIDIQSGLVAYWTLPMTGTYPNTSVVIQKPNERADLTVQGNSVNLRTGSSSYAVIDTGTTLASGPAAQIGGKPWPISNSDFQMRQPSSN
jgi:hypothetical protein